MGIDSGIQGDIPRGLQTVAVGAPCVDCVTFADDLADTSSDNLQGNVLPLRSPKEELAVYVLSKGSRYGSLSTV